MFGYITYHNFFALFAGVFKSYFYLLFLNCVLQSANRMLKIFTRTFIFCIWFATAFLSPLSAQQTIAEWNFPNMVDDALVDISAPVNTGATISTQGGTSALGFGNAGATTRCANASGWNGGLNTKWWEITISTTGYNNLEISSKQYSSLTGPRDFKIQYRIGAGVWTDLPGATNIILAVNFTSGVVTSVPLPVSCNNQTAVSLRWIMTSNISVNGSSVGASGNSRIDDINISWNADEYYRSALSGNWSANSTWESSPDNITWNPAVMPPSSYSKTITIRNAHTVSVISNVNLDETVVESGATLEWLSQTLNIRNGPLTDLLVDGTFVDASSMNILFSLGATWACGTSGTFIKSSAGSAVNWSNNYNGGIASIPTTATWIIRKTGAAAPSVVSVNMYYPNLIIENFTAGNWLAAGSSGFQGNVTNTIIKGSMNIGGNGTGTVEFENINNNAAATVVAGNLVVKSGNSLRNWGTGFELFGDLICDGTITYDATDTRRFIFSGNSAQTISGSGILSVWDLVMNKNGNDLSLLRPVQIDNNITFNNPGGRLFTTATNILVISGNATAAGANNSSFVHGPVQKNGTAAFTFPVGKNNDYQSIAMGTGSGTGGIFWTEDFGGGCNTGLAASSYSGINGSWTVANTGTNDPAANQWFVSAAENGVGAGSCGTGCGNNRTLHLSSTYPSVDVGAAYYESTPGFCPGFLPCSITSRRAESPVINCSGITNITLMFNYIEGGEGLNDNATLWYYDGIVWSQLADMPKTLCCGGVICDGFIQALWAPYSVALPASANNNPNIRIGFQWVNNGNGSGTDPSFAVDDITLSIPAATESFTAEYFRGNPQVVFNNNVNPFINHISQCEYWVLTRDAGTSARTVTLSWDGNSCGVNNLPDLRVANFNGLSWDDRGNGGTTGNTLSGTIITTGAQNNFGPFTLASATTLNPLPVELIELDANFMQGFVRVNWTTASEINNDYFLIQRSATGNHFETIGKTEGGGNSTSILRYYYDDLQPLGGISYYRLLQFDFDGGQTWSPVVAVKSSETISNAIMNITTEESNVLNIIVSVSNPGEWVLNIFGSDGRILCSQPVTFTGSGYQQIKLKCETVHHGVFYLTMQSDQSLFARKFFSR